MVKTGNTESYDENFSYYIVYGFGPEGRKYHICTNGYNPYSWDYERQFVKFTKLKSAQHEADHAPEDLTNITIEHIEVKKKIIQTKTIEKIDYEPKGLGVIIPY